MYAAKAAAAAASRASFASDPRPCDARNAFACATMALAACVGSGRGGAARAGSATNARVATSADPAATHRAAVDEEKRKFIERRSSRRVEAIGQAAFPRGVQRRATARPHVAGAFCYA